MQVSIYTDGVHIEVSSDATHLRRDTRADLVVQGHMPGHSLLQAGIGHSAPAAHSLPILDAREDLVYLCEKLEEARRIRQECEEEERRLERAVAGLSHR
jgi:hypothetical protein